MTLFIRIRRGPPAMARLIRDGAQRLHLGQATAAPILQFAVEQYRELAQLVGPAQVHPFESLRKLG